VSLSLVMIAHTSIGAAVVVLGMATLACRKGSISHKLAGKAYVGSMLLMGLVVLASLYLEPGTISALGVLFVLFINYLVRWHHARIKCA